MGTEGAMVGYILFQTHSFFALGSFIRTSDNQDKEDLADRVVPGEDTRAPLSYLIESISNGEGGHVQSRSFALLNPLFLPHVLMGWGCYYFHLKEIKPEY